MSSVVSGHGHRDAKARDMSHQVVGADQSIFRAFATHAAGPVDVRHRGATISVSDTNGDVAVFTVLETRPVTLRVAGQSLCGKAGFRLACGVFEYLFASRPDIAVVSLAGDEWTGSGCQNLLDLLVQRGVCRSDGSGAGAFLVMADMFWQSPNLWMATPRPAYPRHDIYDGRIFHPARPPKPAGRVYERFIPWLGGVLSLDVATMADLPDVHLWMNNPRVDEFWHEAGDLSRHSAYLEKIIADPHVIPLIGRFDNRAFSYFEVYWAKEDLIGTYSNAGDYDRGCHVIVGEDACRGRAWFTAWLPSLLHFMFLDDVRTQQIVQEPEANHHRQLSNLQRSGFSHISTVDFPGKRAAILSISRQRFFADRLWHPQQATPGGPSCHRFP
jgi:acetyl CoA:N6-hydroxylysine acetyl transferase